MMESKNNFNSKISVIIPCFRCSDTITRAVLSVVNQSFTACEIILVEDYSNDQMRTLNKLKEIQVLYNDKIDIKIIKNLTNRGPGYSRNIAWDNAIGDLIGFLDADDVWRFNKLEIQYQYLKNNVELDAVCSFDKYNLDYENNICEIKKNASNQNIGYYTMLFRNIISTRSVLIKRSVKSRFNSKSWYSEDYWLWLDILYKGGKINKLPIYLSGFFKNAYSKKGLSSHIFSFFVSEFNVIKQQPSKSFKDILIKILALSFCIIKFIKRILIYRLLNFEIRKKKWKNG